ncbi:SMC-Scp complex subunit ScpB [Rhodococcus sp. NPDC003348]
MSELEGAEASQDAGSPHDTVTQQDAVPPEGLGAPQGADRLDVEEGAEDRLDDDELESALEAMLLVIDTPVPGEALATAVGEPPKRVAQMLRRMSAALTARRSGIDLRHAGDGWRYYTRNEYAPYVERLLLDGVRSKLTRAALETLAVVAYRQPLTRARVSAVRGVNVDGVMRTLIARGLIAEAGTDPGTNATTYVTTELFLERLGLASLADLPPLAPLLPDVDVIDDISEDMESDPRFAKLRAARTDTEPVVDTGVDDEHN